MKLIVPVGRDESTFGTEAFWTCRCVCYSGSADYRQTSVVNGICVCNCNPYQAYNDSSNKAIARKTTEGY